MHKDELIKCIKADKHAYCGKPMVLSMEKVVEVRAAMEEYHYNKTAQIVFHNRYFPTSLRAKELIDAGKIDKIFSFRAAYLYPGSSVGTRHATWRFFPEIKGIETLFDAGSYILDLFVSLFGRKYDSVFAASQIEFSQRPSMDGKAIVDITVDDAPHMIMKLKKWRCWDH